MATAAPQIADIEDPVENGARTVETTIRSVDPGDFVTRRYVRAGAEINTGTYSDHRVIVRDAMPMRDHFELDVHGFRIAVQPTAVPDFHDKDEVDRIYEREVEEHVRQLTGADKVVARGWMLRTSLDLDRAGEPEAPRTISTAAAACSRPRARRTSTSTPRPRSAWPKPPTTSISRRAGVQALPDHQLLAHLQPAAAGRAAGAVRRAHQLRRRGEVEHAVRGRRVPRGRGADRAGRRRGQDARRVDLQPLAGHALVVLFEHGQGRRAAVQVPRQRPCAHLALPAHSRSHDSSFADAKARESIECRSVAFWE